MQLVREREEGVSAAIVVIVFGTLLAAALLTMVGDLGQMYVERRELQNGADAAALAAAYNCTTTSPSLACGQAGTSDIATSPTALVNDNASDARSQLLQLCATRNGVPVIAANCTNAGYSNCLTTPKTTSPLVTGSIAYPNFVRVRTQTLTSSATNPSKLSPIFERLISADATGRTVSACAFAAWGGPSSLAMTLPITMSAQCWANIVAAGSHFNPPPPYANPPGAELTANEVALHGNPTGTSSDWRQCMQPASAGGAFGFLKSADGRLCQPLTSTAGYIAGQTGASIDTDCKAPMETVKRNSIVTIAIFDYTNGATGAGLQYHIAGFAKFWVTGYFAPSISYLPYSVSTTGCGGSNPCLFGWFLSPKFEQASGVDPAQNVYGVVTAALVG